MQVYQKPPSAQTEAHTCLSCHRSPLGASTNTMLLEPAGGKGGWGEPEPGLHGGQTVRTLLQLNEKPH